MMTYKLHFVKELIVFTYKKNEEWKLNVLPKDMHHHFKHLKIEFCSLTSN